jgi:Methyltransferase domain
MDSLRDKLSGAVARRLRPRARALAAQLPVLGRVMAERDALRAELSRRPPPPEPDGREFVPAGHFYSAIPSMAQVRANEARLFAPPPRELPGIDLRESEQRALLDALQPFYDEQPFPRVHTPPRRYWFENGAYSYSDAIFLYAMLRHARPRRYVEVGSGHSSCVALDTNELFLGGAVACTFVEPYPELLRSLLRPGDEERIEIVPREVQRVDAALFQRLEANDVLFIDSTHVCKIGSDVNFLLFEVLPRLASGVYVHFHDVFHPFEYPRSWIHEGRAWTEAYLLRSFLTFNREFEIVLFNTFMETFHEPFFRARMPLCLENPGGSIWLRRR